MQFVLQNVCGFFAIHRTTVIMIICHLFLFLSFFLSFFLVWQEVFDNHDKLKPDTIVEVWKGGEPQYGPELAAVIQQSQKTFVANIQDLSLFFQITKAGYRALLSAPWYLNYIGYGSDWVKYYKADPHHFSGTEAQKKLVIGGEVIMHACTQKFILSN